MIQATHLPYSVFTNTIIDQLAELTTDNPSYGIERVVDHTKKEADIRIYLSKGVNPKKMIEKLYKDTSLENYFSINMVLLDQGRFPKIFGWREACLAYITHIRACKRREVQFDLDKALARKNIVDGLIKAYSIIDEIVTLIRSSANPNVAGQKLMNVYKFNEEQAKAILAMKLSSLTKLDIVKLNKEKEQLEENIKWYYYLLNDSTALDNELIKTLREVATKFGDERRTKILNIVEQNEEEVTPTEEKELSIMLFDNNMIRLIEKDNLQGAKRGRKGVSIKPPKNANLINILYSTNLGTIAAFTDKGRMYNFSLNDLDTEKDYSIYELITLQDNEKPILLIDTTSLNAYKYLITVSTNGYIKKTLTKEYNGRIKKGLVAVKLEDNDTLVGVYLSMSDNDKICIGNINGCYNYYSISEINSTGRATKGVKAIKLAENEYISCAALIKENITYRGLLTISTSGRGKITELNELTETSRGVKGSVVMNLKDEQLAAMSAITEDKDKIFITANNKAVLIDINTIPIQGRTTAGIQIIDARNSNTMIKIM